MHSLQVNMGNQKVNRESQMVLMDSQQDIAEAAAWKEARVGQVVGPEDGAMVAAANEASHLRPWVHRIPADTPAQQALIHMQ